jgi:autotransporter translocation and assembly factor TamB
MSKFANELSASDKSIKAKRAKMLEDTTVIEVESFLQNLKREKLQLNNKLNNLTDLAPDNTYSLRPGSKEFNAGEWVKELHLTKMEIALKDIELVEAQGIYDEWFGDETKG